MVRPLFLACAAALLGWAAAPAAAAEAPPPVADEAGVAIGGYDPVAYFDERAAVRGSAEHVWRWRGAEWRFASAAARERFAADPQAYAPRYLGWCAWAMSEGRLAPGDPRIWRIVDGRLYLNCSEAAQRRWEADLDAAIARADAHWAELRQGD